MRCFPLLCLTLIALCVLSARHVAAQDEAASAHWEGIQRLQVDLSTHEAAPFLKLKAPQIEAASLNASKRQTAPKKGVVQAQHQSVSDVALQPTLAGPAASQRSQFKDELALEGKNSMEGRDSLTSEVVGVAKWTVITLILSVVSAFSLKYFKNRSSESESGHKIRVLESLQLGRQQGLKLVEVGGERFLVASDQAGIKSVTLLPSWPAMDQAETQETDLQLFPGEESQHSSIKTQLAAA